MKPCVHDSYGLISQTQTNPCVILKTEIGWFWLVRLVQVWKIGPKVW